MVLLSTKNRTLPGICKSQPQFMGPFQVMSTGPGIYFLHFTSIMDAVHPWFHTSLLKPAGSPALEGDSYEVEVILQTNKRGIMLK